MGRTHTVPDFISIFVANILCQYMPTIEYNVKFATMMKILNGEKKKFERDINDINLVRNLYLLNENGDCVLKESAKDDMKDCELYINSITRDGDFPFILREYDKIMFTNWYGSSIMADIDSYRVYRNGRYWRISYKLKNVVKFK